MILVCGATGNVGSAVAAAASDEPSATYRLTGQEALTPAQQVAILADAIDHTVDETTVRDTVTQVLKRPARTFAQWCTDNAQAF